MYIPRDKARTRLAEMILFAHVQIQLKVKIYSLSKRLIQRIKI